VWKIHKKSNANNSENYHISDVKSRDRRGFKEADIIMTWMM